MKCKNCGKEFTEKYSPNSNGYFCCKKCAISFSRKHGKDGTKIVRCIDCGKEIEVNIRASNKQCKCDDCRGYIKPMQTHKRLTHCLNCEEELIKYSQKKFCSYKCQTEYENAKFIKDWKDGLISGSQKGYERISQPIRRYIFEKFDNKCTKCSWNQINPFSNKSTLTIEHIDGNPDNHKEENLTLLCPNCHSLTSTYGALNKGKGRISRRKQYQKQKSLGIKI